MEYGAATCGPYSGLMLAAPTNLPIFYLRQ